MFTTYLLFEYVCKEEVLVMQCCIFFRQSSVKVSEGKIEHETNLSPRTIAFGGASFQDPEGTI
jgi:hypothetical protein